MNRAKIFTLVALLFLGGCQTQMRMLETTGEVRVEPSPLALADYVVYLRNTLDFGYNPDDKENRTAFALKYMKSQCAEGRIVKETVIQTGTYGTGRPSRIYALYVKC